MEQLGSYIKSQNACPTRTGSHIFQRIKLQLAFISCLILLSSLMLPAQGKFVASLLFLGGVLSYVGVQSDPSTVQQTKATLIVYGQTLTTIPVSGYLQITIPTSMSLTVGALTCSMVIPSSTTIRSCTGNGKVITVVFSKSLSPDSFELHISNSVSNPTSTTPTSTFLFATYNSGGTLLDYLYSGIFLTATEGTMSSSSLTPSSQIVGASTSLLVKFKANHDIPSGASIQVTFPKWNPNAPSSQQLEYLQGSVSCTTSQVLSSSMSCSFSSSTLTVSSVTQTTVSSGTEVAFFVSGFRNPLSTAQVSGFTITTLDSTGGSIDKTSSTTLQISTAGSITSGTIAVDSSTSSSIAGIVQESNIMKLTFNSPVPLNSGCVVRVTLPSDFSVSTVSKVYSYGMFGTQSLVSITKDTSSNYFQFSSCSSYTQNTLAAGLIIDSLTMPTYTKTTGSIKIAISSSSSDSIASVSTGITFTPIAGSLSTPVLTPTSTTILSSTSMKVQFTIVHSLDTQSRFVLTFPSVYTLGSTCSLSNFVNINAAASCSFNGQSLSVTNILGSSSSVTKGTVMSFTFATVTLPQTMQTQSFSASIQTTDSSDGQLYSIDTFSGTISVTFSYGSVSATVTPSSYIAYDTASYKFDIIPQHYIPQNGYIKIIYPSDLSITDYSFSQSQCSSFSNFPTTPTCVISTSSRTITINNGFRSSSTISGGTKLSLTVPGITNPPDLEATDSFKFYTYMSDGQMMDQIESGVTVKMTSTAYMKSVYITLASYINSASTKYTFTITPTVPVYDSYYVIVAFPTEITIPTSNFVCSSDDTNYIDSVKCSSHSLLTNAIKAQLSLKSSISQINVLQTFRVTFNSIVNPPSTAVSSAFTVQITNKLFSVTNKNSGTLTVQTNTPQTLSQASLEANTTVAGQFARYTITITPKNSINKDGGVLVIYPSQLVVIDPSATLTSVYTKSSPVVTLDRSSRSILIRSAFQQNFITPRTSGDTPSIVITLSGFRNPLLSSQQTSSFIIRTFNVDSTGSIYYYIDQVADGLVLNNPCNYPCNTCTTNLPSNCTSCYSKSEFNKLQGGTCVSACSVGNFFNSTNGMCMDCSSTCLACQDTANTCTQCGIGNLLYLINNTCAADCPSGYVKDSSKNLCQKCINNCQTCVNTSSTCTSCFSDKLFPYLYQTSCLASCPANISVPLSNNLCGQCDNSCKTCSNIATNCTSCLSHMRFDPERFTCTSVCQEGTQIYDSFAKICRKCDSSCQTCAGTTSTCTTCRSGLVLTTENSCKSQCTADNQIPIDNVCKQCELPCAQCKGTLNKCTKCQGDYYLYNSTCIQYCPEKYEPNNQTSQCVLVGLICPSGFTINDLGDGCIPNEIECPNGYIINDQRTACVPGPGAAVPFPFLILSFCLGILVVGSEIKDKTFTKAVTCLIALISSSEMLIYALIVCYSGAMAQWVPFVLSLISVLMQMTVNIGFFLAYKKDIMNDQVFQKWTRLYPKSQKYITIMALVVNYKCIKFIYSGFYGLESCIAQFEDAQKNLFRPLRLATYFNFIFIYIPILVADVLIFTSITWGYQLLILSIESFLITLFLIALTLYEMWLPVDQLIHRAGDGDEQYIQIKPKSFDGQTLAMSGIVDIDESTLVRSKVIDDEYEVILRKKALASILDQVGKNFITAQEKGIDLGGQIDQCMTKFDEDQIKLRRAFSLDAIKEEDSWEAEDNHMFTPTKRQVENYHDEPQFQRRHSYPLSPKSRVTVPDPQFKHDLQEIKAAVREQFIDNVYAECRPPEKEKEIIRKKMVSRRTQTYLRELLQLEGEDVLAESDLEIVMEEEAEIDNEFAKDLIDNVIDGLSESESNAGANGKKKRTKKKKGNPKKIQDVPDFELADIMGEFEIDDLGNFIILRGEKGELLDKKERRVNRRGYLIDRFGNVINKQGQIIFRVVELDSDDEIPAPFGFEKRKKNLLNLGEGGEFKIDGNNDGDAQIQDDEDLIDRELKEMKKSGRRQKKRQYAANGQIIEEGENDEDDESSIDSLMAESPGKYQQQMNQDGTIGNFEDEIIDQITKKKIPKKRPGQHVKKSPGRDDRQDTENGEATSRTKKPLQNQPPKRIKREDTKEMFPSLAIDSIEQRKLYKIAEHIGSIASQIVIENEKFDPQESQQQQTLTREKLEKLKQEHFKDIISESQMAKKPPIKPQATIDKKPGFDKIYGNLHDVVSYEVNEQLKATELQQRTQSPFASLMTSSRLGTKQDNQAGNRRLRGLESIYLQKFDKKPLTSIMKRQQQSSTSKAKFRNTMNQFNDDPSMLLDDGQDVQRQNEMSMMVAEKLDKLQKQYLSNTASNNVFSNIPITSMGFSQIPPQSAGGNPYFNRKAGSVSGSMLNQDLGSLDLIKKGNWVRRDS